MTITTRSSREWQGPSDPRAAVEDWLWQQRGHWLTAAQIADDLRAGGQRFPRQAIDVALGALWERGSIHSRPGPHGRVYAGSRTQPDPDLFTQPEETR